jgi:purine-cytosine permease-like protein
VLAEETPDFGIEPVPERLRVLGILDGFLLWANLSVSLLVIVAGAFLVLPENEFGLALSLPEAAGAIVAAAVAGNVLLGLGGLIGADARVPTMVLMRAPLGRRGSYLPTALNVVQCLGWSVFELIIIATGASALSRQVLG